MRGEPISELNKGLQVFYNEIKKDKVASQCIEVCVLSFNENVYTLQEPSLVGKFCMPTLTAKGSTAMVDAVNEAIEKVEIRKKVV